MKQIFPEKELRGRSTIHTDKKENQFFFIYKEIKNEAVANIYKTNGILIKGKIFAHFFLFPHI